MSLVKLSFFKNNPKAVIPTAKSNGDVGLDIHSVEEIVIPAGQTKLISTGLQLGNVYLSNLDTGLSVLLKIEGRSGLASKGIFPVGGIVDTLSYTGEIKVALVNSTNQDYKVSEGDRIAQFVVYPVFANSHTVALECVGNANNASIVVEETDEVRTNTNRGVLGFGSSGK